MLLSSLLSSLPTLVHFGMILLLILGFGFIIFWHELGHFLAAKWVDIRVEQFAVGFGHAIFSYRKGIGVRIGSTQKEYREKAQEFLARKGDQTVAEAGYTDAQIAAAADELGLGETEYRLNYIPLGGYVKMAGQDDLKPDAPADDPRAYQKKSVGARMLVISAGVILNVILAAIGFMVLFMMGFNVAPAWVGNVIPGSPAQVAGLQVGDHILEFDNHRTEDFTKVTLITALVKSGDAIKMIVDRPDRPGDPNTTYHKVELTLTPAHGNGDKKFLSIGFVSPVKLEGVAKDDTEQPNMDELVKKYPQDGWLIKPGDVITAVNGQPVTVDDYVKFYDIVQKSHGQPVSLTIKRADGKIDDKQTFQPHFEDPFSGDFNLAGMEPRVAIWSIGDTSPALGKIMPLDAVDKLTDNGGKDTLDHPSYEALKKRMGDDGTTDSPFTLDVIRAGQDKPIPIHDLHASVEVGEGRHGLGVALMMDEEHTKLADVVPGSVADKAGLKGGDTLTAINGKPVTNWFQVQQILAENQVDKDGNPQPASVTYTRSDGQAATVDLKLDKDAMQNIQGVRYMNFLSLREYIKPRIASGPAQAALWGVTETRDFVLQFYLTIRRMVDRSIPPSSAMGPVGIFIGGKNIAYRGGDWLLWFLSMISANLAVVNFLPIPVVDGGQFMFLVLEKIKGKPLSTRAMTIAQYVGLAFLAAIVLFVTYHDIMRIGHYG